MSVHVTPVRRTAAVMGTVASIHVHDLVDATVVHAAVDAVIAELERLEAEFSTFRHDSLVSRINTGQLHPLEAGDELTEVLDACAWLEHDSGGRSAPGGSTARSIRRAS